MSPVAGCGTLTVMPCFLIHHRHKPEECAVAFAAFKGHDSAVRHRPALASCQFGGHSVWWWVEAGDEHEALALLPFFVASRATATRVRAVPIP